MRKLYIVRLTKPERVELQSVVKKLKGTGQKVRRAQILLKADANGPNWIDERIAESYACRTRTVERLRQRFVVQGFEETLNRVEHVNEPRDRGSRPTSRGATRRQAHRQRVASHSSAREPTELAVRMRKDQLAMHGQAGQSTTRQMALLSANPLASALPAIPIEVRTNARAPVWGKIDGASA